MEASRRSTIVKLSLLGMVGAVVVGASVIPEETQLRRNLYQNRTDCERDYSPQQCEPTSSTSASSGGGSGGGGVAHGPYYAADRRSADAYGDPGPGRLGARSPSVSVETSTRGGFGTFGRVGRAIG